MERNVRGCLESSWQKIDSEARSASEDQSTLLDPPAAAGLDWDSDFGIPYINPQRSAKMTSQGRWIVRLAAVWGALVVALLGTTSVYAAEKTKKVLVLGIDGCRPDALQKANAPNLKSLAVAGAYTYTAQNLPLRPWSTRKPPAAPVGPACSAARFPTSMAGSTMFVGSISMAGFPISSPG